MAEVGFEPMPSKWLVPETSALENLAILPIQLNIVNTVDGMFLIIFELSFSS